MAKNPVMIVREDAVEGVEITVVDEKVYTYPMTSEYGYVQNDVDANGGPSQTIPLSSSMASPVSSSSTSTIVNGDDAWSDSINTENSQLSEKNATRLQRQIVALEDRIKWQNEKLAEAEEEIAKLMDASYRKKSVAQEREGRLEAEKKTVELEDLLKSLNAQYTGFKSGMDHCFKNAMELIGSKKMETTVAPSAEKKESTVIIQHGEQSAIGENLCHAIDIQQVVHGKFYCICEEGYKSLQKLRNHIKDMGGDPKLYCNVCGRHNFPYRCSLVRHLQTHTIKRGNDGDVVKPRATNRKRATKCGKQVKPSRKAKQQVGIKRGPVAKSRRQVGRPSRICTRKSNKKNSQRREVTKYK